MHIGKAIRLERILDRNTRRTILVPLDHGVSIGPVEGLIDMRATLSAIAEGGANAVLMHKGLVRCGHRQSGPDIGLIVHLSASTSLSPAPGAKSLAATVEDAIRLGADAVSVHVNIGDESERTMLADLGAVTGRASEWGIPVMAMVYARGPKIEDEYDPALVAHCARVGLELNADVVKLAYTGDPESFGRVVDACCVPVVIAGGPKLDSTRDLMRMAADSVAAGGAGLSIGRNIFQAEDVRRTVAALAGIVHQEWDADRAMEHLESGRE
jgi:class I fructose-bisphosphate aldolase